MTTDWKAQWALYIQVGPAQIGPYCPLTSCGRESLCFCEITTFKKIIQILNLAAEQKDLKMKGGKK